MTNPFRTKNYGYAGEHSNNNTMLSYQNEMNRTNGTNEHNNDYGQKENPVNEEFSSPEENRKMQGYLQKQESQTEGDQSSSSMSGYDLKGMLSRAQNQATPGIDDNYGMSVQNQHRKSQNTPPS